MSEKFLTVKALNEYLKYKIEKDIHLSNINIKGEISNFKKHSRGHLYFTLKDEESQIDCIMFATDAYGLSFIPKDGMKVILTARLSVYVQTGRYQLYVSNIKDDGLGDLYQRFILLKEKLEKEGYYNKSRELPKFPKKIGVITSETGAVIKDIINTVNRRYPLCEILLYPSLVQGVDAKSSLVKNIKKANSDNLVDVIIIGRGGGSLEDLWPFNEEEVAYALFNSKIPTISAVGHETDFSITDFVADHRAPTPTAAAEIATPNKDELYESIKNNFKSIKKVMDNCIKNYKEKLLYLDDKLSNFNPKKIIEQNSKNLNNLYERLIINYKNRFKFYDENLKNKTNLIKFNNPSKKIKDYFDKLDNTNKLLNNNIYKIYDNYKNIINNLFVKLDSNNPLRIMEKGFSITSIKNKYLRSINDVNINDEVITNLKDGNIISKVIRKEDINE